MEPRGGAQNFGDFISYDVVGMLSLCDASNGGFQLLRHDEKSEEYGVIYDSSCALEPAIENLNLSSLWNTWVILVRRCSRLWTASEVMLYPGSREGLA